MDAGIFDHLDRIVRVAKREYEERRTAEAEKFLTAMLQALAAAERYREHQG